jgi:hypothetical protein
MPAFEGCLPTCVASWPRWPMGEISRSLSLVESARTRTASIAHVGTKAYAAMHAAMFELMRGDVARVRANATEPARLNAEHDLSLWRAFGGRDNRVWSRVGAHGGSLCSASKRQTAFPSFGRRHEQMDEFINLADVQPNVNFGKAIRAGTAPNSDPEASIPTSRHAGQRQAVMPPST